MAIRLNFYCYVTRSAAAYTPSAAPTITIVAVNKSDGTISTPVSATTAMTGNPATGIYFYTYTSADPTAYEYLAVFATTDSAADPIQPILLSAAPAYLQTVQAQPVTCSSLFSRPILLIG